MDLQQVTRSTGAASQNTGRSLHTRGLEAHCVANINSAAVLFAVQRILSGVEFLADLEGTGEAFEGAEEGDAADLAETQFDGF